MIARQPYEFIEDLSAFGVNGCSNRRRQDVPNERVMAEIRAAGGRPLNETTVGVWGLTFKADTDDLRDSPAVAIVRRLLEEGATVQAFYPAAGEHAARLLPGIELRADAYDAANGADAVVLLTEWDAFRWLEFDKIASLMRRAAIVDARNLLDPAAMRRRGFDYVAVGRR